MFENIRSSTERMISQFRRPAYCGGTTLTRDVSIARRQFSLTYTSYSNDEALINFTQRSSFSDFANQSISEGKDIYVQQVSLLKPTFLAVIGPAQENIGLYPYFNFPEAVRAVVTDSIWLNARRADIVVDLSNPDALRIYSDKHWAFHPDMPEMISLNGTQNNEMFFSDRPLEAQLQRYLNDQYFSVLRKSYLTDHCNQ